MQYLVTAEEMRRYDRYTIEEIGIPAAVLMERAALAACRRIEKYIGRSAQREKRVLILAGMGNNGGDGLALARLLSERGFDVEVWCVGEETGASEQWRQQKKIVDHYPVRFSTKPTRDEYTILVDALFGVGLSREITGVCEEAVKLFCLMKGWKLALDLPSGVDSDTGKILGAAVCADETVTFGFCKRGLTLYPGCRLAGKVTVADIGIPAMSFGEQAPGMYALDEEPEALLPTRDACGNKGTFGKVLLVAGSVGMAGAAVLAARAAYRMGVGMVRVITPEENRVILQESVPEALVATERELAAGLAWADVIAIGPGLGRDAASQGVPSQGAFSQGVSCREAFSQGVSSQGASSQGVSSQGVSCREAFSQRASSQEASSQGAGLLREDPAGWTAGRKRVDILEEVLRHSGLPLLIDGDGLNLVAEHEYLRLLVAEQGRQGREIVLTPHVGELSRLMGRSIPEVKESLWGCGSELAMELQAVVVAKDARTFICHAGKPLCVNLSGDSGLATAGSGDVLAGMIAGLMAQGMPAYDAACAGAYIHGRAGERVSRGIGQHACMAGDLLDLLRFSL